MKVYVVTTQSDTEDAAVLKVFKALAPAQGYVKGCINLDKASHYKEVEYEPSITDDFLEKHLLVREVDGYEEELWYLIWEEELL